MKRIFVALLILLTSISFSYSAKAVTPKPWTQYGCDIGRTSVAADVWDYMTYDKEAWSFNLRGMKGWARNPVVNNGVLFIGDADNAYSLDVANGKAVWTRPMTESVSASCAVAGDIVVVPTKSKVLGLSSATGDVRWSIDNAGQNISSPTIVTDERGVRWLYYSSSQMSGVAFKYNMETQTKIWEHNMDNACMGGVAVNSTTEKVGVASHIKLDLVADADGTASDSYTIAAQTFASSMAFKSYCAFTMQTGEVALLPKPTGASDSKVFNCGQTVNYPPALYGEMLILGNDKNRLVCFDEMGNVLWDTTMPGPITAGCTVMGSVVLVPVGSVGMDTAGVYIVKAYTGEFIKKIPLQAKNVFQPVVAWNRMFVEYGDNVDYVSRKLSCYGQPPIRPDEPKMRMEGDTFSVEVPMQSSVYKLVKIFNTGRTNLKLKFSQDPFIQPTVNQVSLRPSEMFTLSLMISSGNNQPGNYNGQITIINTDANYGDQQLGTISASITVKDKPPQPMLNLTGNSFSVTLDYQGESSQQVTLYNVGQVTLNLYFSTDPFLSPSVNRITLRSGQTFNLTVTVEAGNHSPGTYHGLLNVMNSDPNYGEQQLGTISADIRIKQPDLPPQPPVNVQAVWAGDHVQLSWSAPYGGSSDIIGYAVYRYVGVAAGGSGQPLESSIVRYYYQDYSVTEGNTYTYFVRSIGRNGQMSDFSNPATVTVPANLNPVSNLTARVMGLGSASVSLYWSYDRSNVGFRIFLDGSPVGTTYDRSFTDHNPPARDGIVYTVYPFMGDRTGPGASVTVNCGRPEPQPKPVHAVQHLTARVMGLLPASIALSWQYDQQAVFHIELNGMTVGTTSDTYYSDFNPPNGRLVYTVYAEVDGNMGPPASVVVNHEGGGGGGPEPPGPIIGPLLGDSAKVVIVLTADKDVAVVNGNNVGFDGKPYISGGRMMVPFRFLGENIGAQVSFTTDTKTKKVATVKYVLGTTTITLTMGSKVAKIGDKTATLDVAPEIKGGRTFVPLRFITEVLGGGVAWNAATRSATITYPK